MMPTEDLSDVHSCAESFLEPSTPSASLLDSRSHIARTSGRTTKHERGGSLGLIDAARVRLSKDFRSLICSTNKLQRVNSVSSVQTDEIEDHRFVYPEYASNLPSQLADLDIERMELTSDDRHGRGLGTKIANFLSRSRSRSRTKKRRSRSLDAAVSHIPTPLEGASLVVHGRHLSLEQEHESVPVASSSNSRPAVRSPSRPFSSATTATNTTVKPLPKKPPKSLCIPPPGSSRNTQPLDIHTEVVIVEQATQNLSRKTRKMNLFGLTLPSPRKSSFYDSSKSKSRPTTPGPQPSSKGDRGHWVGRLRSNSGSTSHKSHDDSKHSVKGDILFDNSRPPLPNMVTPQSRPAPIHVLNGPLSHGEYAQVEDDVDADLSALGGRCSPLCGLGPPNIASTALGKGKEKERVRGARDRSLERSREREREQGVWNEKMDEKERDKDRERITHPRRVGSPICRESGREARTASGPVPMERIASGSGNGRQSRARDGTASHKGVPATSNARPKQIKHGTFDFERPTSAGVGGQATFNVAPRNVDERINSAPHSLQRSLSARGQIPRQDREVDRHARTRKEQATPTPDSQQRIGQRKPALDVNTQNLFLTRRPTGSSAATSTHPRPQPTPHPRGPGHKSHQGSEGEPGSPISSTHSGNSSGLNSSWGKSAGKRIGRSVHPAFKFEPAVPPIPGSPAGDERKKSAAGPSPNNIPNGSSPLSKTKQARMTGKGRSLDLGLGLSWAPSKVREEAILRPVPGNNTSAEAGQRARSRWRGATLDEDGRLGAVGAASDVASAFREVLGDAAYATFKTYVHRFDSHAIPLDGPFGLIHHVQRLLDSAPGTDPRRKQALLDRFVRVVQENH